MLMTQLQAFLDCNAGNVLDLIIIGVGMVLCIQIMIISEQLDKKEDDDV